MKVVSTIEELKKIAGVPDSNGFDGFIALAGGLGRSSKQIWYDEDDDSWELVNWIDESEASYSSTEEFMANETNIMYALNNGALIEYP
jgi:hypothetical protein